MDNIHEINIFDIEDIIANKIHIEQRLIEHGEIEDKLSIKDFVTKYLNMNNVYMYKQTDVIPFTVTRIADEDYLIICAENKDSHKRLSNVLKRIDYNVSKLKSIDVYRDASINDFDNVFYINNKIYVI